MNKSLFLLLAVAMTLCQCKKKKAVDNPTPSTELPSTGDNAKDMDIYLSGLKPIPQPMVQNQIIGQPLNESTSDGALLCTTTKYALGKNFEEGFFLDPTSDVIFPGAILDGNSVAGVCVDRVGVFEQQTKNDYRTENTTTNASIDLKITINTK